MALATDKQLSGLIDQSSYVILVVRKNWELDGVAAALALAKAIRKRDKRADVVIEGFHPVGATAHLPQVNEVQTSVKDLQRFVISLDVEKTKVDEIFYDLKDNKLRIHVTPKSGRFEPEDLSAQASDFKYDLAIILDSPDLRSLGKSYSDNPEFFFSCPTVNIDHEPSNERFASLNLVDVTAAATSEIVALVLRELGENVIDEETATLLLTGLIAKTRSFRVGNITPRTLDLAAELMAAGADREEIVRKLFRTRDVATLKLWGRALARLKYEEQTRMAWTVLVRQDFIHAGASDQYLPEVIDELIMTSPDADVSAVLFEKEQSGKIEICALIATEKHLSAYDLVRPLNPSGNRRLVQLCFPGQDMLAAEKQILSTIKQSTITRRLNKTN